MRSPRLSLLPEARSYVTNIQFSIIVPAFNVQGYLRQAVESVAGHPSAEVLIIDDRSTDDTSVLADELAATHREVSVVRPPSNAGLGEARNLGLRHAVGDYILFLDGDDYFVDGAIDRIGRAIRESSPDIVMFGYARLYPNGRADEGIVRSPLQLEGAFTAGAHPEVYTVLNVAWNKAYRRAFLEDAGLAFPPGYYEDIPWTYPLLASARSIVGIDKPLYMYRQRWSGSILRSTDARHLEILDQFDRLIDRLDTMNVAVEARLAIFDCAFRNLSTLLTHQRGRVPDELRRDFYARVREAVKSSAPDGYRPPKEGFQKREMSWIWVYPYALFESAMRVRLLVRGARNFVRKSATLARRAVKRNEQRRLAYQAMKRVTSVDSNLVVFENLWGRSPRLNCLAVARELQKSHAHMQIVWSVRAGEELSVPEGMGFVVHGTREHFKAIATAKYLFVDANLPGWWSKRSGQVLTQLHHGTPLKFMGVEERGKSEAWKSSLLRRCAHWDFSVVSNAYSAEVWKHSYPVNVETLEVGYPRNDVLVNASVERSLEARRRLELPAGSRVLLYMPTFRPEREGEWPVPDIGDLAASLDESDVVLVRGHYFGQPRGHGDAEAFPQFRDVSDYEAVEDLYLASDVLITDYSSAMFDYAVLRRPIIVFAYDWDDYRRERGTYFDITVDSPGVVARNLEELAQVVSERLYEAPSAAAKLLEFAQYFTAFDRGDAAMRVVSRVVDGKVLDDYERNPATHFVTTWNMDRSG